jgi:hypothetical protein
MYIHEFMTLFPMHFGGVLGSEHSAASRFFGIFFHYGDIKIYHSSLLSDSNPRIVGSFKFYHLQPLSILKSSIAWFLPYNFQLNINPKPSHAFS